MMSNADETNTETPESAPQNGPKIGTDEWVAQVEERRQEHSGPWGKFVGWWDRVPNNGRYAFFLFLALSMPVLTGTELFLDAAGISNNAFILRTGVRFLTFAVLAIGLNVVVGYAGLLDLGYIAYMGIAGYLYAYMSSEFVVITGLVPGGLAVPAIISIPLIIILTALVGWVIGTVSIRLAGDYFAIVTLGFGLVFTQLALTMTRVKLPWTERAVDFTRGPNGINRVDNISLFGFTFETTEHYYYLFLVLLVLVFVVVNNLNKSRTGRSWRALHDDELAAEVMSVPTRYMKVLAVIIGAGIAALAGSVDTAFQGNVVPNPRYSALTLINLYAMVVLGGLGSLPGAILGAFIFTVLPEALRSIQFAGFLFYGVGILMLFFYLKPKRFLLLMGGTIMGGLAVKLLVSVIAPQFDAGYPEAGSVLNQVIQGWLIIPPNFSTVGNVVTIAAVGMMLLTAVIKPPWRWITLGVTIYMATFAWETRLAIEPAATRILVVGFTLVLLMIFRPHGILGKPEVRVV
ncbi:MAG: branched-chain amino acid ABC transporter permease [Chloroflexi bacterium]|nr:branched-chain amino acid ABC transporter permease [Chloroflexota bacterium]